MTFFFRYVPCLNGSNHWWSCMSVVVKGPPSKDWRLAGLEWAVFGSCVWECQRSKLASRCLWWSGASQRGGVFFSDPLCNVLWKCALSAENIKPVRWKGWSTVLCPWTLSWTYAFFSLRWRPWGTRLLLFCYMDSLASFVHYWKRILAKIVYFQGFPWVRVMCISGVSLCRHGALFTLRSRRWGTAIRFLTRTAGRCHA